MILVINDMKVINKNLPDGIYLVKYKVNEKLFVEKIFIH